MHTAQSRSSAWNSTPLIAITIVTLLAPLAASQIPEIAGTWKVNIEKSEAKGAPSEMTIRTRVEGREVWFITTIHGSTIEMRYNTEGKQCVNHTPDATVTSTVKWEGGALVGVHHLKARDWELTQRDRITWSRDGKTMTVVRVATEPKQRDQKVVYDRQ